MKRHHPLIIVLFLFCSAPLLFGQYDRPSRLFKPGETDVLLGFGLLPTFLKDRASQLLPAVSMRLQRRLLKNYSLSLEAAHSVSLTKSRQPYNEEQTYRNRYYAFTVRNAVHCNCERFDNWDIYGGLSLGLNLIRIAPADGAQLKASDPFAPRPVKNQFTLTGFLGAMYACSPRLSFWGELGYGISLLQVGVGYRL